MASFKSGSTEKFNNDQLFNNYEKDRYEYKSLPRSTAGKTSLVRGATNAGGHFVFPRRQRFNEDIDNEIVSQRVEQTSANKNGLTEKVLKRADSKRDGTASQSRFSNSKKTMTVRQLSKYFNDKKTVTSNKLSGSISNANLTKPDKKTGLYIKKGIIDVGNPRYAASKASTMLGGLTTGQHVLHERKVPAHYAKEI